MIAQDTTPPTMTITSDQGKSIITISQKESTKGGGSAMHYQTFTPKENMLLDSIAVKHGFPHNAEERTIKLKLYEGSGVAGTLLGEAINTHKGISSDGSDYYSYYFSGKNISLTANTVYTWQIYFEGSQTTGWIDFADTNPYPDGYGYYCCDDLTNDDFLFVISGSNTVGEGEKTTNLELALIFTSSEATVDFTKEDIDLSRTGGGSISDFNATSSTVYTARFIPAIEGWQAIGVKDGSFTDASGNSNAQFSITQTKSGFGGGGAMHYQTFTAKKSMGLDFIQVKHGFPHNAEERTIKLKLYEGSGVAGTLLGEAINTHKGISSDGSDYYSYYFSGKNISLTANTVYTWQIYFEGSQTTGWISFAGDNPYPGGYGYYCCDDYTDDDFLFKIQGDDVFVWNYSDGNESPSSFKWVDSKKDTINITKDNLATQYKFEWTKSTDPEGNKLSYILHAKIGATPWQVINEDVEGVSFETSYQEFLENAFEPFPTVNAVTAAFSMDVTDGIDTVKIDDIDKVIYIRRYDYLSTIDETVPATFALHENYPNPFNPTTTLRFDLAEVSDVNVVIYNMLGQKVRTFNMNSISAGSHSIKWNATNDLGDPVGAGVYLYQLKAKDFLKTRKMVLMK